jgi:5-methylcytosine-specific restriction endonuclease McrA
MPGLSEEHRAKAIAILAQVRSEMLAVTGEDRELLHQMRRYIAKRLEFDERGTPTQRRKLKDQVSKRQRGLCAVCREKLPERGAELDRFKAIDGYTVANTQLLCQACHRNVEAQRGLVEPVRTARAIKPEVDPAIDASETEGSEGAS